tara:strand:+ start:142 stop:363 length:222 start_codon:yes stop_codon:yes gene_type:complete
MFPNNYYSLTNTWNPTNNEDSKAYEEYSLIGAQDNETKLNKINKINNETKLNKINNESLLDKYNEILKNPNIN